MRWRRRRFARLRRKARKRGYLIDLDLYGGVLAFVGVMVSSMFAHYAFKKAARLAQEKAAAK